MNYSIKTFGCKVNTYDTSLIQKQMDSLSKSLAPEKIFFHIVNTCAVTETAVLDSLRWIRNYRKKNPRSVIVVTGCGAQAELDYYAHEPYVDVIIANSHKDKIFEILEKYQPGDDKKVFHSNIFKTSPLGEGGQVESHRTRFFLKIQDGCSQFCTFCIIPFARGKSRSLSTSHLIEQIKDKHSQGVLEVVLTGVHIGDYQDQNNNLSSLVSEILKKTKIPRIRLSSLEPPYITEKLLSLYQDERMCPHFHLSIQSASSSVLKNMKRNYNRKDVEKCLNQIHKKLPQAFIGMDVIAGFPCETQKDFEDTYQLFKNTNWNHIHVFPYSSRPKTYAQKMKNHLSREKKTRRAFLLRHLSSERLNQTALSQVGSIKQALPLKKGGICRDYWSIEECKASKEVFVKLLSWNEKTHKFRSEIQ